MEEKTNELEKLELIKKQLEISKLEKEINQSFLSEILRNPISLAILGAVLTLIVSNIQRCGESQSEIEQRKYNFESQLILDAIDVENKNKTKKNLKLLTELGMLSDTRERVIENIIDSTELLNDIYPVILKYADFYKECYQDGNGLLIIPTSNKRLYIIGECKDGASFQFIGPRDSDKDKLSTKINIPAKKWKVDVYSINGDFKPFSKKLMNSSIIKEIENNKILNMEHISSSNLQIDTCKISYLEI